MPVVKRFRPLGQVKIKRSQGELETDHKEIHGKVIKRFKPLSDERRRSDRKHRYPLRVDKKLWNRIWEFSINCGGSGSGASLNVILNKLIVRALDDEGITTQIRNEYPDREEFIKIRTWRRK